MKIIENPPQDWVHNLREGCEVWLTKERAVATVVAPFTRPVSSSRTGRLFIRKNGVIDYWFVSSNGKGIDGSTQAQRSDFHLTRAQREGISRAEAKIRNFLESYGSSSPRVCPKSR